MKIDVDSKKSKPELTLELEDGRKLVFAISNKHVSNKIKFLVEDMKLLSEKAEGFDEFYFELFNHLTTGTYDKSHYEKTTEYAEKLIELHELDLSKFCVDSKRTKNSIFFEQSEVKELLIIIGLVKLISPLMYTDEYKEYATPFLMHMDAKYKPVMKKIYNIIKMKVSANNFKLAFQLTKIDITLDHMTLYNYEFILLTALVFYNWITNPLSFIVSVASDVTNFWIMTLYSYPYDYMDELSESSDSTSEDFLDTISYEIILDQVDNAVSDILSKGYTINDSLYLTPLSSLIVLPLMSAISDISLKYLRQKSKIDKWKYHILIYTIINNSNFLTNLIGSSHNILLYGYTKPVSTTAIANPAILEVLKTNIDYYQLNSRVPLLNLAQELSTPFIKPDNLEHVILKEKIKFERGNSDKLDKMAKNIIKFMVMFFDESKMLDIKTEGRNIFMKMISNKDISQNSINKTIKMFLSV